MIKKRYYMKVLLFALLCLLPLSSAMATGLAPLEKLGSNSYKATVPNVEWISANAVLRATTPNQMVLTTTYVLQNTELTDQTIIMGVPKAPYKGQSLGEPVITVNGEKSEFRTVKMTESPDGQEGEEQYITWYTFSISLKASEIKGFDISYIIIPDIAADGTYTAKLPLSLNRFWAKAPANYTLTVLLPYPYSLDPAPSLLPASRREDGAYVWNLSGNAAEDFYIHLKDTSVTMQRYFNSLDDAAAKAIYEAYTKRNVTQVMLLAEEYLTTDNPTLPHVDDVNYILGLTYWMMDQREQAIAYYDRIQNMGFGESAVYMSNKVLFDKYNYLLGSDPAAAAYLLQTQPINSNAFFETWVRRNAPGPQITPTPEPTETPVATPITSVTPQATPQPEGGKWPLSGGTTIVLVILLIVIGGGGGFLYYKSRGKSSGGKRRFSNNMRRF